MFFTIVPKTMFAIGPIMGEDADVHLKIVAWQTGSQQCQLLFGAASNQGRDHLKHTNAHVAPFTLVLCNRSNNSRCCADVLRREYRSATSARPAFPRRRASSGLSKIEQIAGGLTPGDASAEQFKREVLYAHSWFNNITKDIFG